MVRENRIGYEFHPDVKQTVIDKHDGKCAVTGRTDNIEVHHLFAVAIARGFFPTVDKEIFTQEANALPITHDVHVQLHNEMSNWPKEFVRAYAIGMYRYLRDLRE